MAPLWKEKKIQLSSHQWLDTFVLPPPILFTLSSSVLSRVSTCLVLSKHRRIYFLKVFLVRGSNRRKKNTVFYFLVLPSDWLKLSGWWKVLVFVCCRHGACAPYRFDRWPVKIEKCVYIIFYSSYYYFVVHSIFGGINRARIDRSV